MYKLGYIYMKLDLCFKHKRHLLSLDPESYIFQRGRIFMCFSRVFHWQREFYPEMSDLISTCMKGNWNRASFYGFLYGFFFHFNRTIYYTSILSVMIPYKNNCLLTLHWL